MADLMTYRDAVAEGLAREMRRDPDVVCLGEDIGAAGGVFKTTVGLLAEFGPDRVRDTPISEQAIVGMAMGAAMTGIRPVAEIMFSDFLACCWDYLANEIPKMRYMTGGQVTIPLVIRTANGGGLGFGAQHIERRLGYLLVGCLFQGQQPDLRAVPVRDDQLVLLGDGRQAVTRHPDVLALVIYCHWLSAA